LRRGRPPRDATGKQYRLRFGEFEAKLTEADVAQLHDSLRYLHRHSNLAGQRLCASLAQLVEADEAEPTLECGVDEARKVQLAIFAAQGWRKRISPALAEARLQAFRYLDQEGVIAALQQARADSHLDRRAWLRA
jgi:hypothetical protein